MEKLPASTRIVKDESSRKDGKLYKVIVDSMTRIAVSLRQDCNRVDWESMAYALKSRGLSDDDCERVRDSFDRCLVELDFIPKPKDVIAKLRDKAIQNKAPDVKLLREYYRPYSETLREHVFEYEGGYSQVKLEKVA